jgi:copper chaperone CopZ
MATIVSRKLISLVVAMLLVILFAPAPVRGEEKNPSTTTITVGEMCGGCVKKITARFEQEKSVAKLKCDIKTKTVTLTPAKNVRLSPRTLWEIMESIRKTPKKLVGPDGTYTSKPESTSRL